MTAQNLKYRTLVERIYLDIFGSNFDIFSVKPYIYTSKKPYIYTSKNSRSSTYFHYSFKSFFTLKKSTMKIILNNDKLIYIYIPNSLYTTHYRYISHTSSEHTVMTVMLYFSDHAILSPN